jgi:hypothetical protein
VNLDNILVITEFDGEPFQDTEFLRTELGPVFEQVFPMVEGAPSCDELNDPNTFFELMAGLDTSDNERRGPEPTPSVSASSTSTISTRRSRATTSSETRRVAA